MRSFLRSTLLLAVLGLSPLAARADVKLNSLFSEHAVLQRGMAVPVWGTAEAGEEVTVELAGQKQSAKAGADGKWKVALKSLKEAEGLTMTVKGKNTLTVPDISVGEVWVASGQSNMAFRLQQDVNAKTAAAAAADPQLRFFGVPMKAETAPIADCGGKWVPATPTSAPGFSAVAYYFARDLRAALKVPVGILSTSVGGTPAEAWTSLEGLKAKAGLYEEITDFGATSAKLYPEMLAKYQASEAKLMEKWKIDTEKAKAAGQPLPRKPAAPLDPSIGPKRPTVLYNGMVAPLQPYAIRGAIWYQGEANSARGKQYRTLFPAMIADWRKVWKEGDFPFLFVQIAPHLGITPELREAQLLTSQTVPKTAMAVITDFGEAKNIHPTHKEPPGQRLALAARAVAYGEKIEYSGPTFDSMKIDKGKVVAKFSHAAGLMAKGGDLKGFTIAGADGKFFPAKGEIKGETITLSADGVAEPKAIRYGFENVPDVNLYNGADLPASPFRSDVEK